MESVLQVIRSLGTVRLVAIGAVLLVVTGFFVVILTRMSGAEYELLYADLDAADREIANLNAVCGPSAMSTSSGLLGSRPLREAAPDRFSELSRDYKSLLDRALVLRVRDAEEEAAARLQALADHLGTLNAGPRDVVDLHRTVIAELVHDQVPQKARAYIDEGRLVLVQLMGYLAAYYRSLTWGGRRLAPARSRP